MTARMDPNGTNLLIRCCFSGFASKIKSFAVFMANALLPEWSKGVDLRPTVSPKRVGSNPTGRTVVPFVFCTVLPPHPTHQYTVSTVHLILICDTITVSTAWSILREPALSVDQIISRFLYRWHIRLT